MLSIDTYVTIAGLPQHFLGECLLISDQTCFRILKRNVVRKASYDVKLVSVRRSLHHKLCSRKRRGQNCRVPVCPRSRWAAKAPFQPLSVVAPHWQAIYRGCICTLRHLQNRIKCLAACSKIRIGLATVLASIRQFAPEAISHATERRWTNPTMKRECGVV